MANSPSGESVLERVVRILETFTSESSSRLVPEIAHAAQLPPTTAHRLVGELVATGLLDRDDDGQIRLGVRLWELAHRGSRALELRTAALPVMHRLQARLRGHTVLAAFATNGAVVLEHLAAPDTVPVDTVVGGRLPLHATSSGLVLLAHQEPSVQRRILVRPLHAYTSQTITCPERLAGLLHDIRRQGFCVCDGSPHPELTGVAAPVRRGAKGPVLGALAVGVPRQAPIRNIADVMRSASSVVSGALERF